MAPPGLDRPSKLLLSVRVATPRPPGLPRQGCGLPRGPVCAVPAPDDCAYPARQSNRRRPETRELTVELCDGIEIQRYGDFLHHYRSMTFHPAQFNGSAALVWRTLSTRSPRVVPSPRDNRMPCDMMCLKAHESASALCATRMRQPND